MPLPEITLIGERIRQYMKQNKITLRKASERSGFAISTISEIINGKDKRISYYFLLSKSINMPLNNLCNTDLSIDEINFLTAYKSLNSKQKLALFSLIQTLI